MEQQLQSLTDQLTQLTETIRNDASSVAAHPEHLAHLTNAADAFAKQNRGPAGHVSELLTSIATLASLGLFNRWRVFDHIPSGDTVSYQDLAEKLGADTALITRLSWNLIGANILKQVGEDRVTQTPSSAALSAKPLNALIEMFSDDHLRAVSSMPEYFSRHGLREPSGQVNTIYSHAAGDPAATVWEIMNRDPARMQNFMVAMAAGGAVLSTAGVYDFGWVAEEGKADLERTQIVDVGGGKGHALESILEATPGLDPSRCVVEDLEAVVDEARETADGALKKARFVAMDFHSEQPVKGALAYYIRRCLHDYGDDDAVRILSHIRAAMRPDSRCVVVEQVMGNPPSAMSAAADTLLSMMGGKERTLGGWRDVTARAGLGIREVYYVKGSEVAVIECVVV